MDQPKFIPRMPTSPAVCWPFPVSWPERWSARTLPWRLELDSRPCSMMRKVRQAAGTVRFKDVHPFSTGDNCLPWRAAWNRSAGRLGRMDTVKGGTMPSDWTWHHLTWYRRRGETMGPDRIGNSSEVSADGRRETRHGNIPAKADPGHGAAWWSNCCWSVRV